MIHHGYSHTILGKGPQGPMVYHLVGAFNLSHNQHIMYMYEHRYRFFYSYRFPGRQCIGSVKVQNDVDWDGKDPSLGLVGYKSP